MDSRTSAEMNQMQSFVVNRSHATERVEIAKGLALSITS